MSYRIVPERSRVWIDATSSVHPIHAETDGLEGFLDVELTPTGALDVEAPARGALSFDVDRLRSGNFLEDREMRRRIDVRRYPTIEGELVAVRESEASGSYEVTGDVTFRGVTQRCTDQMGLAVLDDDTIQLTGASTFDVRDFGMEPPRILVMRVHPEVDVRVEIVAATKR